MYQETSNLPHLISFLKNKNSERKLHLSEFINSNSTVKQVVKISILFFFIIPLPSRQPLLQTKGWRRQRLAWLTWLAVSPLVLNTPEPFLSFTETPRFRPRRVTRRTSSHRENLCLLSPLYLSNSLLPLSITTS